MLFEAVLDSFLVVSLVSRLFEPELVSVVAVLGCAWPSWLIYVAFGVIGKLGCFRLFQTVCVVLAFKNSLQLFRLFEDSLRLLDVLCCLLVWFKLVFFLTFSVV